MAINRYFTQNPRISGPLQFLAGFGQQRQQVKAAEAQMDFRNDQALSQGIAQAGQTISRFALAKFGAQQNLARLQLAAQNATTLQTQRTQAALFRDAVSDFRTRFPGESIFPSQGGGGGVAPAQGGAPLQAFEPAGLGPTPSVPTAEFAGPPEPGGEGVPSPIIDPGTTTQYRNAQRELNMLTAQRDMVLMRKQTPEERNAQLAILDQQIARVEPIARRQQKPPPPTTIEELESQGFIISAPGIGNYFELDPKTGGYKGKPIYRNPTDPVDVTYNDGTTAKLTPGSHTRTIEGVGIQTIDVDTNGNTTSKIVPFPKEDGGPTSEDVREQAIKNIEKRREEAYKAKLAALGQVSSNVKSKVVKEAGIIPFSELRAEMERLRDEQLNADIFYERGTTRDEIAREADDIIRSAGELARKSRRGEDVSGDVEELMSRMQAAYPDADANNPPPPSILRAFAELRQAVNEAVR